MQKSDYQSRAVNAHRKVASSTALDRKHVKRPSKIGDIVVTTNTEMQANVQTSPMVSHFVSDLSQPQSSIQENDTMTMPEAHPVQVTVNKKMRDRFATSHAQPAKRLTAQELKAQAIKKALADAERSVDTTKTKNKKSKMRTGEKIHFGFSRVMLAMSCAAVAVLAIAYFVNINMPDISLKVAAMQTGIEATYPSYVPRDFSLSDIASESGKITLKFKNSTTGDAFTIVEEQSAWDSNALLSNYVKPNYGDNFSTIREQGLTLYMSNSDACWVNGGVVYKLTTDSGSLTKKQIKSVATSL